MSSVEAVEIDDDGRARRITWIMAATIVVLAVIALLVVGPWSRPGGLPELPRGAINWTTRSLPLNRTLPAIADDHAYVLAAACTGGGTMAIQVSPSSGTDRGAGTVVCDGKTIYVASFPGMRIAPLRTAAAQHGPFSVHASVAAGTVKAAEFEIGVG
jgi:hypothetical protein